MKCLILTRSAIAIILPADQINSLGLYIYTNTTNHKLHPSQINTDHNLNTLKKLFYVCFDVKLTIKLLAFFVLFVHY